MRGRASIRGMCDAAKQKLQYNAVWVLQVLLMADLLRDSSELSRAVSQAMRFLLPPVLRPVFEEAMADASSMPNAGTVSRWRFLLDASFMLWRRERNANQKFLRWIIADSSTQHGRTFQLAATLNLKTEHAARALQTANELVHLWCLGALCECVFVSGLGFCKNICV